jgi:hypothetical protein
MLTYGRWWQMHFGFAIDTYGTHSYRIFVKSELKTDNDGKSFKQKFHGDISVVVLCDENVPSDVIDVDDVERGPKTKIWLRLKCPKKKAYYRG